MTTITKTIISLFIFFNLFTEIDFKIDQVQAKSWTALFRRSSWSKLGWSKLDLSISFPF